MILGLDDIPGGTTIISFLIWIVLTGLYYLVCYLAVLNVLDDVTGNSWIKLPALLCAAIPCAGLMAVFNYKPYIFAILVSFANYFRIKKMVHSPNPKMGNLKINPVLFYLGSYSYITLLIILTLYFSTLDFGQ